MTPQWVDWMSGIESALTILVILVGAVLAFWRFRIFKETAPNAEFHVAGSNFVANKNDESSHVMLVNLVFSNRARTTLRVRKVELRWDEISPSKPMPSQGIDAYKGPKVIMDPQELEPGEEAWGVAVLDKLSGEAEGCVLGVRLEQDKVGFEKLWAKVVSRLHAKQYQKTNERNWWFYVPAKTGQEARDVSRAIATG